MAENLTPKKYIDSNNMKQILTAIKDKTPVGDEYVTEEQLLAKDYATKTYVGEQIVNAEHLKREIVTVLPSDTEASDNIIYMLKVESATGNDKYQEYMKIDGTVQMVGDTSVDLTDYAKTVDIPTTVAELTDSSSYAKKTDIPTTLPANGGNADTVNNHTVKSDVPENAKFTDTIYDDTELNAKLGKLDDSINGFKNFQIVSSLGSVKLKEIIQSEFPKIKNDRGMIKISDGTTLYCGTYIKYSNTQGSVTFTNVEGTSYIWIIRGDTVTLQELVTMDKLGGCSIIKGTTTLTTNQSGAMNLAHGGNFDHCTVSIQPTNNSPYFFSYCPLSKNNTYIIVTNWQGEIVANTEIEFDWVVIGW